MRWSLAIACLWFGSCRTDPPPRPAWKTAYWLWESGRGRAEAKAPPLDSLYFHAGEFGTGHQSRPLRLSELRTDLPPAREYWPVIRYVEAGVPDDAVIPSLAKGIAAWKREATERKLPMAGVQLDIDSPTRSLARYATFLAKLRAAMEVPVPICITALGDWFAGSTAIDLVIAQVDEFVPQFYDTGGRDSYPGAIAAPIDASLWGPRFNRFGKPFRIGIAAFGRSRFLRVSHGAHAVESEGYVRALDLALNPAFTAETDPTPARELILRYRAHRPSRVLWRDIAAGDTYEFTLSTPEAIATAVAEARKMGGQVAGVIFFRWPTPDEALALPPEQVLAAAGAGKAPPPPQPAVRAAEEAGTGVTRAQLYLSGLAPLNPRPQKLVVLSSTGIDYFLPHERTPARMTGARLIEVSLPPYTGRRNLFLGTAVNQSRATFTLREEP